MAKRFKKSVHSDAPRSQRQLRVGELLRQKLSEVFSRGDVSGTNLDTRLVTVTEVRVSPDLKKATAFVVPLLQMTETLSKRKRSTVANSAADLIEELNRHAGALRIKMGDGLHLKYVPSLSFKSDDSFDNAAMMIICWRVRKSSVIYRIRSLISRKARQIIQKFPVRYLKQSLIQRMRRKIGSETQRLANTWLG